ncbi:MAG: hypothetical protein WBC21_02325 [Minisyncoccales bacterium]
MRKIKIEKWEKFFKKLPRNLAENAFRSFMILVCLALIFGSVLFYKYSVLAEKKEPEVFKKPIEFKENIFENILKEWEEREVKFNAADTKEYPDLLKEEVLISEEALHE